MAERFDRESWERRWSSVLGDGGHDMAARPPNGHVLTEVDGLPAGRALDAGCGHGAETLWLAQRGWHVTGVDFSAIVLDHAREQAARQGDEVARRATWIEADLTTWAPPPAAFDLVLCVYVHVVGSVREFVARLGSGVAAGGTLLLVGHLPVDPATGEPTRAAAQNQVSVEEAVAALDLARWEVVVAEPRPRRGPGGGADAVVRAVRR